MYDLIIIGGGVAGFSAALYAGRFQLKTLVISEKTGGTLILAGDVSNYPGFESISGLELFDNVKNHAQKYGVEVVEKKVEKLENCDYCFKVSVNDKTFKTKTIIFATGTEWRKLKVPGEKEFANKGVHYCALCDGAFYKDKVIAVVGGSDSASKEALLLTEYAKKVYIIYRKDNIRAEPINLKRVMENKKIEIINKTNVTKVKGDKFVNGVLLDKEYNGSKELKLDATFISIGHIPISKLAESIDVKRNEKGEIITDEDSATNIKGVFACGDVVDSKFKQAITGAAEGVIAAYNVYQYITNEVPVCGCSGDS
ncbi:MAG: FAD-dependent oxidoreductase [Nanoarchaeota archaeon]|nr:FAD-dependent oxidoreductase [Nanoarchaeota archaeon]